MEDFFFEFAEPDLQFDGQDAVEVSQISLGKSDPKKYQ
jgi:hypothetical protein